MKFSKTYDPSSYEQDMTKLWDSSQCFEPSGQGSPFTIVLPPLNANGNIHAGHALTVAIEDIASRYHRQKGDSVLFIPGTDHAGFETWVVYERNLEEQGKSRFDFSREELYKQVWDFVALNRDNLTNQTKRLGASVDWKSYTFTLDPKVIKQAYSTFHKMWDEGLIYRGEKLVNYCTKHGTGFSDIEVAHSDEKGHLWHIAYPLTNGEGEIVVATTRPETMLGDTAVAVAPDDKRFKQLVGKTVHLPLTKREIPVLEDSFVDKEYGTGAVKVTPAHDFNDFEVGERHDLPKVTVINRQGLITDGAPEEYRGLSVKEARKKVVEELEKQGLIRKIEDIEHSVGKCYKCGTVIEPLLNEQWFIDMQPLAKEAIKALEANKIQFYPDTKKVQLINYLKQLKDWNISRQIAWGIPIPAFVNSENPDDWIYDERVGQENIEVNGKKYIRDNDVFDTWFSSGSWPYVTLDFPDGDKYKKHYPLSLMETGFDILYPWVGRMIMFGLYETGEVPFKEVYMHGMVTDEHGKKQSKSKGNVVNPIEFVDKYGSDAVRMGLISGQTAGQNQPFSETKTIAARNFCNKIWNISRYIDGVLPENFEFNENAEPQTTADHWIASRLRETHRQVYKSLDNYRFGEAYETVYHFIWDDVADWYIEANKSFNSDTFLAKILKECLVLVHPFAPFLTETIWQNLAWEKTILAGAQYAPEIDFESSKANDFTEVKAIISESRYITKALKAKDVTLNFIKSEIVNENSEIIKRLARLKAVAIAEQGSGLKLTTTKTDCWLDVDPNLAKQYASELAEKAQQEEQGIKVLKSRLSNENYVANAPAKIVDETKNQLAEAEQILKSIRTEIERFKS
jgi:valyl-tRNA synthetase